MECKVTNDTSLERYRPSQKNSRNVIYPSKTFHEREINYRPKTNENIKLKKKKIRESPKGVIFFRFNYVVRCIFGYIYIYILHAIIIIIGGVS